MEDKQRIPQEFKPGDQRQWERRRAMLNRESNKDIAVEGLII